MFEMWKKSGQMIAMRIRSLLLFEILFRIYSNFLVFPLSRLLFNACMRVTKINCLTFNTIGRFITNPIMLACSLVIVLFFAISTMLEISCLVTCLYSYEQKQDLTIFQIIREGIRDARRMLLPRNWIMLILMIFLMPLTQISVSTSILKVMHMSSGTFFAFLRQPPYCYLAMVYIALAIVLFLFCITMLHVYVLENCTALQAVHRAYHINVKHKLKNILVLFATVLLLSFLMSWLSGTIRRAVNTFLGVILSASLRYNIMLFITTIFSFLVPVVPTVAGYAIITVYYANGATAGAVPRLPVIRGARRFNRNTFYVVAAVCVSALLLYDTVLRPLLLRYDIMEVLNPQPVLVVSHRGDFSIADENTLSAINAAIDAGADCIEIDVQMTKDGVVIVNHDKTFGRVFGVRKKANELTFEETRALRGKKSGECPPTLYEVLELCRGRCSLLIELKDDGQNPLLPIEVFNILQEYEMLDSCRIQSSSYTMLSAFKQQTEDVPCGYILSLSLGNYVNLRAADFYSIESVFVDSDVVNEIHSAGKGIFVWTINTEAKVKKLYDLGVDGIITDNVPMLKDVLLQSDTTLLNEIVTEPIDTLIGEETLVSGDETSADAENKGN